MNPEMQNPTWALLLLAILAWVWYGAVLRRAAVRVRKLARRRDAIELWKARGLIRRD